MSEPVRLLAFSGSARTGSINQRLIDTIARLAEDAGAEVTAIKTGDFRLPLYDGDLEEAEGLPENAVKLKALFKSHDGFLIACPEYNGSITPLLKNLIDWISRPEPAGSGLVNFQDKVVGLYAASGGGLGGIRGLAHVRQIFSNIGANVAGRQLALGNAMEAYAAAGAIANPALAALARDSVADVIALAQGLKAK